MLSGPTWVVKSRDRYFGGRAWGDREWVAKQGLALRFGERNDAARVARMSEWSECAKVVRLVQKERNEMRCDPVLFTAQVSAAEAGDAAHCGAV